MAKPPVTEQVQVNFRMPVALRDRIKRAADKNGRSMNGELLHALEIQLPVPYINPDDLGALIEAIRRGSSDELSGKSVKDLMNEVMVEADFSYYIEEDEGRVIFYPRMPPQKT